AGDMHANFGGPEEQRVAYIVAVADPRHPQAIEMAKAFADGEQIPQDLTGMLQIGEAVDHRNPGVFSQRLHGPVREGPRHDPPDPALQVSGHVGYALPRSQLDILW